MNANDHIFKDLYDLQFKFVRIIDVEYWSTYNKTLKKIQVILDEQNFLCSHHLSFLQIIVENLCKHDFILNEDLLFFKSLLSELKRNNH